MLQFAVKGSKRTTAPEQGIDLELGMVHVFHMEEMLSEVINELRAES